MSPSRLTLHVRIGRIPFEIEGPADTMERLEDFMTGFMREPGNLDGLDEPVVRVELYRGFDNKPEIQPLLRDNEGFTLWQGDEGWRVHWEASNVLYGTIDLVLHTSLIHILTMCAVERGALVIHGAGFVANGRAFVAPGRSGAGKSTLAHMFPEADVLNDEFVLLWHDEGVWIASTPFFGSSMAQRRGWHRASPLFAILQLEKAPTEAIKALDQIAAYNLLMTSATVPALIRYQRESSSIAARLLNVQLLELSFSLSSQGVRKTLAMYSDNTNSADKEADHPADS